MGRNDSGIAASAEWVIDTTVLSTFALAQNLDILGGHCQRRARWTTAVYSEILEGVSDEPRLGSALVVDWLEEPEPVFEVEKVENLRLRLGGHPRNERHLGEATSIVLAQRADAGVLVDDRDAKQLAESVGVRTGTTVSVLKRAVQNEDLAAEHAAAILDELINRYGRRLPNLAPAVFES